MDDSTIKLLEVNRTWRRRGLLIDGGVAILYFMLSVVNVRAAFLEGRWLGIVITLLCCAFFVWTVRRSWKKFVEADEKYQAAKRWYETTEVPPNV